MQTQSEIRTAVTNNIVAALESGDIPFWRRPWSKSPGNNKGDRYIFGRICTCPLCYCRDPLNCTNLPAQSAVSPASSHSSRRSGQSCSTQMAFVRPWPMHWRRATSRRCKLGIHSACYQCGVQCPKGTSPSQQDLPRITKMCRACPRATFRPSVCIGDSALTSTFSQN
jgi:hypothetical protein